MSYEGCRCEEVGIRLTVRRTAVIRIDIGEGTLLAQEWITVLAKRGDTYAIENVAIISYCPLLLKHCDYQTHGHHPNNCRPNHHC